MRPSSRASSPSRYVRVANAFQRVGEVSFRASRPLIRANIAALVLYAGGGSLLRTLQVWSPSYPFLSPREDLLLLLLVFVGGFAVCLSALGLVLLAVVGGVRTTRDWIATILAFVSLGIGASVLRYSATRLVANLCPRCRHLLKFGLHHGTVT